MQGETGILVDPDKTSEIGTALKSVLLGQTDERFRDKDFLRNKSLDVYGFKRYTQRVRILLNK